MDKLQSLHWISLIFWILIISINNIKACVFYSKSGLQSDAEGVRFIRIREDKQIGYVLMTIRAYPHDRISLRNVDHQSTDHTYFRIRDYNGTTVQIMLDKSLEDLVDRDVPQNLLKFRIDCLSQEQDGDGVASLSVTVYIEDVNDHSPKFIGLPYQVHIDELTPIGSTIFKDISAFDRDKPNTPNSDVQYSIGAIDNYGSAIGQYFALQSLHRPFVILRKALDYDDGLREFNLTIHAADRGVIPRISNTTLKIIVEDNDDLPPRFTEGVYRTKIKEFYPITGNSIHTLLPFNPKIMAYDQDSLNASLLYDIISGNERKLFTVDSITGQIYLQQEIDLEEESLPGNTFVLQLEASQKNSPIKRALARVEIEILDLNDNVPEFEADLYNISIVENLPSAFSVLQVQATDRDQGENAEFFYDIVYENPSGAFVVDPRTGWITVRDEELLDREARPSIKITVQAIEKQPPYHRRSRQAGAVDVEITLLDSNDNTPTFEFGNLYEFKINVDAPIGQSIGLVSAIDPDEGRNGMILYEMKHPRGSTSIPFKLDSNSGELTVDGPLRYGRIALFVEASDQPTNPSERRYSLAVVTVQIDSFRYNGTIEFVGAPYEFWVGVDVLIGASVGQIRTDGDLDFKGEVLYDLLHSYVEGVPFAVEEKSGVVTVIRDLKLFDRNLYEFEAVAAYHYNDSGQRQLIKRNSKSEHQVSNDGQQIIELDEGTISDSTNVIVTNVTIHVVSHDDNRGIIMRGSEQDPIVFHVKENLSGALIGQLLYKETANFQTATTVKPKIKFSKFDQSPSKENPTFSSKSNRNGREQQITRNQTLSDKLSRKSRETAPKPIQNLPDMSNIHPEAIVRRPRTKPKVEEVETMEHTQYETKTTYGKDGNVPNEFYERYSTSKTVKPTDVTKDLKPPPLPTQTIDTLAGNEANNFEVVITPRPMYRTGRQSNLYVVLPSTETNETKTEPRYQGNTEVGTTGLRFIIANQQDVGNGIKIYNDGTLSTTKPLDREDRDQYHLTIIAEYTKGIISGAGIYQVTVYVDDVNDNKPIFNRHAYIGSILENSERGSVVTVNHPIYVTDTDLGDNAEFSVSITGVGSHLFNIAPVNKTGNDRNDLNRKRKPVRRHRQIDSESKQPNSLHFVINYTGPSILDRESDGYYNLKLTARDKGGLTSESKLEIIVNDVNDNPPIFVNITIFKDSGIELLDQSSIDQFDIHFIDRLTHYPSHILTYPIGDHNNLDKITYGIRLSDFFSDQPYQIAHHMFNEDQPVLGTPRGDSRKDEKIIRRRKDDHSISNGKIYLSIVENIPVGLIALKITAIDEDYKENALINYGIDSENLKIDHTNHPSDNSNLNYFTIDRLTGDLKINRPLLAESELILNISARDIGNLTAHKTLVFKVIDVNDHPPIFDRSWYSFDVSEGTAPGNVISTITATDKDFGQNANVSYKIDTNDPRIPFTVDEIFGTLKVNGELDRERKSSYEFKIIASDNSSKGPKLSSSTEIEINILDLNDNSPEFVGYDDLIFISGSDPEDPNGSKLPIYKAYIDINIGPNSFVKQVTAVDRDFTGNGNGLVMYSLQKNRSPNFVEIDSRDGTITTITKLNRYHGYGYEHFNVTVTASDLGNPSRTSTAVLLVNLQGDDLFNQSDSNDDDSNRLLPHKYYEIDVPENSLVPMFLLQINVTELYRDQSFKWSIIPEMEIFRSDEFSIDPQNGSLWLVKPLDREDVDSYKLKIRAEPVKSRDGRQITPELKQPIVDGEIVEGLHSNEVRVVIKVTDDNDNFPLFMGDGKPIIAVIPNSVNFGYPVTKVTATDADIGINADIKYRLLNELSGLFDIDSKTGDVRVLGPIPGDQRVYGFDVKASDRRGMDNSLSTITNVFVYVLDERRQVRLIIKGRPLDVEGEIEELTRTLSEATGLDVRVRLIEPHPGDETDEPSTDVYIYAVDPRSNTIIDMEELQSIMKSLPMENLTAMTQNVHVAKFGSHSHGRYTKNTNDTGCLQTSELATIILAVVVFIGGLTTAICIGCVRKRNHHLSTTKARRALTYSMSAGTQSTIGTLSKKSGVSAKQILGLEAARSSNLYNDVGQMMERPREYIDVPLPQSVHNGNFNLMEHDTSCMKYNQLQNQNNFNLDTSVVSLQSSGLDSGLDLSRDCSTDQPAGCNQIIRISLQNDLKNHECNSVQTNRLIPNDNDHRQNCSCGPATEFHICKRADDSSDSYEDSLKNQQICNRMSQDTRQSKPFNRNSEQPISLNDIRGRRLSSRKR